MGNLQSHQKSTNHERCEYEYVQSQKKEKAKPKGKVYKGPMDLQRKKIDEMDKQKIMKLLNTAYFVMKNELTLTIRNTCRVAKKEFIKYWKQLSY